MAAAPGDVVVVDLLTPYYDVRLKLHALARLADRYSAEGRRLRPIEVVQEYEKTILDELDLMREAAALASARWVGRGDKIAADQA